MGLVTERLSYFFSLIALILSLSLTITAIVTEHWFDARVVNDRGIPSGASQVHAGLFAGRRVIDWGLGTRRMAFSVLEELADGTSFMGKANWVFTVAMLLLGVIWLAVATLTTLAAAVRPTQRHPALAGPCGVILWTLLSLCTLSMCLLLYYLNYAETIAANVLLEEQVESGFTTENQANLGYSFYMLLTGVVVLVVPLLLLCCCTPRRRRVVTTGEAIARRKSTAFVAATAPSLPFEEASAVF